MNIFKDIIKKIANYFGFISDEGTVFKDCLFLLKKTERDKVILDVGAYHGDFSKKALNYFKNAKIFAFEPQEKEFLKLKKNLKKRRILNYIMLH